MSLIRRIRNLWELSEYHPGSKEEEEKGLDVGTKVAMIIKPPPKPPKDIFIPRITRDPVKEIVHENN